MDPHFGFLVELGFDTVTVDASSFWDVWVRYVSSTAAVQVSKSTEFRRTEISLIRLQAGEVPPYPIWVTAPRIDWALLDTVVELRRPDLTVEVRTQAGLSSKQVQSQLTFWSGVLRDVAPDFLAGEFAALDQAGDEIWRRVSEHPQSLTVHVPSDASAGAGSDQAAAIAGTLPPNVEVKVSRYVRRQSRGNPAS